MSIEALQAMQGWVPPGVAAATPAPIAPTPWAPPGMAAPTVNPTAINPPEFQPPPMTPAQAAPVKMATEAAETPKKKRGRPSTKAAPPAEQTHAEPMVTLATVEVNVPTPPPATTPAPTAKPLAFLFVGCRPVRASLEVTEFETLLSWVHAQIKDDLGVDDFSFVDYGKGSGAVGLYAAKFVAEKMVRGTCLVIDTRAREASLVLSRLLPLAENVIRGI